MQLQSKFRAAAVVLSTFAISTSLFAQTTTKTQVRSTQITRATAPIRIDAVLDDAGWTNTEPVRAFVEYEPREGAEPPVATEVMLRYDDENLYIAFSARDPEPSRIRATLQPRDRLRNSDDYVAVMLDPYGDGSVGYYFAANPLGVQADMQMATDYEDESIDFIYKAEGKITADGYIVEMAIPFRSLRLPNRDVQSWGVMLLRSYPRSSRHEMTWPSLSRDNSCMLCQMARLEGVADVKTGGNLELLPSLVLSRGGTLAVDSDPDSFENESVNAQASLGVNCTFRPGWTAEVTVNPDFSQVESDAAQIDVNTTFALFYPERRPFFQKGMDLYATPFSVFYSRSINAPAFAGKLTGRTGNTSFGYIGARDEHTPFTVPFADASVIVEAGNSTTNVLRVQHNFGGSKVGAMLTDRRLDGGGAGTTLSTDLSYRFNEMYSMQGHLVVSHTAEPNDATLSAQLPDRRFGKDDQYTAAFDGESFNGLASFVWFGRNARKWSWNALYLGLTPTYRADTGFDEQNDYHRATVYTGVSHYPNKYGIERFTYSLFGGGYWRYYGDPLQALIAPGFSIVLPRQTEISLNATVQQENFRGVQLTGLRDYSFSLSSHYTEKLRFGFDAGTGRRVARNLAVPEVANGSNVSAWAAITPIEQLVIEPTISYEKLHRRSGEQVFAGYVAHTRVNYQYNRELNVRVLLQYNDFDKRLDVEPLIAYQLNPLSIFYVGAGYGGREMGDHGLVRTDQQYFMKFQYLLR